MSELRFVPIEWVRSEERSDGWEISARDLNGRFTKIPLPGVRQSVLGMAAIIDAAGFVLRKVEIRDVFAADGGLLFLRRRLRTRRVPVQAALAVSLAVRYGADLWLAESVFGSELQLVAPDTDGEGSRYVH